jgi:hypothetical protein
MRNSAMKKIVGLIAFLIAQAFSQSISFGQSEYLKRPIYHSPAEGLTWLKVDTNNIEYLKLSMYDKDLYLSSYAALFLAERGHTDIIPMVKAKYDSEMVGFLSGEDDIGSYLVHYLTALFLLHDDGFVPMTKAFIDSILSRYDIRTRYFLQKNVSNAIQALASAGDYSQFNNLKMLTKLDLQDTAQYLENTHTPNLSETDFTLLNAYGEKPEYRNDVFNLLKEFASNPRLDCREKAEYYLSTYFKDISETHDVIKNIAISDPDFDLRCRAIFDLWSRFEDPAAISITQGIILSSNDTNQVREALWDLADFKSPYAYAALLSCYQQRTQEPFRSLIKFRLDFYRAPLLSPNIAIKAGIDSLRAYTLESQNLKWIGGREFVNKLTNHLANAKKHLDRKDSLNSSREIEKYQSEINKEYKEGNNRDNRFVTAAGWKYLYMEAGYVIARLIQLPHRYYGPLLQQLDSLNSELKREEDLKNVHGLLLTKSLELLVNQADKELQRGDSTGTALNLTLFQLLVDQTNELTGDLKTKRQPPLYVSDEAYIQLYYLAKYILGDLPQPRESVDLPGKIDKDLQQELEKMKREAIVK